MEGVEPLCSTYKDTLHDLENRFEWATGQHCMEKASEWELNGSDFTLIGLISG
jgi:hypothetical protein